MSYIRNLVFLFTILVAIIARADIYTANSVQEINNTLMELLEKRNAQKTLTILPLEGFVLNPVDPALNIKDRKFQGIVNTISKKAKLSRRDYIKELVLTEYEQQLSDPEIVKLFQNIQQYNAPFIVVTANSSGSFNKIPYLETWTWEYLLKQDIDLSQSPIGSKQILFKEGRKKVKGTYPTLYRGLLSANSVGSANSSQELIANLLAVHLKWIPDIIYIIGKDEEYIKSIEQQFRYVKKDIQVIGFIYTPEPVKSDTISPQEFSQFWEGLINKLNLVSRKEISKDKENPYEQ